MIMDANLKNFHVHTTTDDFKHGFYVLSRSEPEVTLARIQDIEKRFVSRESDFEVSKQRGTF